MVLSSSTGESPKVSLIQDLVQLNESLKLFSSGECDAVIESTNLSENTKEVGQRALNKQKNTDISISQDSLKSSEVSQHTKLTIVANVAAKTLGIVPEALSLASEKLDQVLNDLKAESLDEGQIKSCHEILQQIGVTLGNIQKKLENGVKRQPEGSPAEKDIDQEGEADPFTKYFLSQIALYNELSNKEGVGLWKSAQTVYNAARTGLQLVTDYFDSEFITMKSGKPVTALHIAVAKKHEDVSKLLVGLGANPNEQSEMGTPSDIAKQLQLHEITECFDRVLTKEEKTSDKEARLRKLLSHAFECKGDSPLSLEINPQEEIHNIDLQGTFAEYHWSKFGKTFSEFGPTHNIDSDTVKTISSACKNAANHDSISYQDRVKAWEEGQPVIINTGSYSHHMSVLIMGDRLVILDRGGGYLRGKRNQTIATYKFEGKLTADIIEKIETAHTTWQGSYTKASEKYFGKELPKLLSYNPESEIRLNKLQLPIQKMGNCAWANCEGLIFIMMVLIKCKKEGIDLNSIEKENVQKLNEVITSERILYEDWRSYQQLRIVERYMKNCQNPDRKWRPDWTLLGKCILTGYIASQNSTTSTLKAEWEDLYQRFNTLTKNVDIAPQVKTMMSVAATASRRLLAFGIVFSMQFLVIGSITYSAASIYHSTKDQ